MHCFISSHTRYRQHKHGCQSKHHVSCLFLHFFKFLLFLYPYLSVCVSILFSLSLKYLPAIYIRSHSALAFIRQYFHIQPPLFLRDALHSDQISFFSAISCSFPIKKAGQTAGYTFQCKANLVLPKIITIQFSPLLGTQSTLSP